MLQTQTHSLPHTDAIRQRREGEPVGCHPFPPRGKLLLDGHINWPQSHDREFPGFCRASNAQCSSREGILSETQPKEKPSRAAIGSGRLRALPRSHPRPIKNLVIYEGPSWGACATPPGTLILGSASRLDAFSASPCGTWLSGGGPGGPTGTPAVPPPRSSRTGGDSPQRSYARDG